MSKGKIIRKLIFITYNTRSVWKFYFGRVEAHGGGYFEGFHIILFGQSLHIRIKNWEPGIKENNK